MIHLEITVEIMVLKMESYEGLLKSIRGTQKLGQIARQKNYENLYLYYIVAIIT